MLTVIVVKSGVAMIYPAALRPANLDYIDPCPAEEFLGKPDVNFSRGGWDNRIRRRFGALVFGMGAGQLLFTKDSNKQEHQ
jgi:hypothetical protein